jgi:two-component system chemotaxis response regulator CheB
MTRPAIDPMFRSAAHSYSRRVIGVLMTGNLDDGTAGLGLIKDEGGITVVQDPKDAKYPGMPLTALEYAPVDYSIPLREIGPLIVNLVHSEIEEVSRNMEAQNHESGQVLSCPGCGGILTQESAVKIELYLCQVGHRYTRESLILAQNEEVEHHLWSALAILKQKEEVARKIAEDIRNSGSALDADSFEKQAQASAESQEMISRVLNLKGPVLFPPYFKWPPKGEESS